MLGEAGDDVEIISASEIIWIGSETPGAASNDLRWRVREALAARGAVGPFPLDHLVDLPGIVRLLPSGLRDRLARRSLRPVATAWLKPRAHKVRLNPGRSVVGARAIGDRVGLVLDDGTRPQFDHDCSHGYRIDIASSACLRPICSPHRPRRRFDSVRGFESTVPGLHFAGSSALKCMGPLMRFVWGAGYAARAVTRTVAGRR